MIKQSFVLGSTAGLSLASVSAFAVDHSTAITAAQTDAEGNTTAVITAVIAVAAVAFGAGIIYRWLSR